MVRSISRIRSICLDYMLALPEHAQIPRGAVINQPKSDLLHDVQNSMAELMGTVDVKTLINDHDEAVFEEANGFLSGLMPADFKFESIGDVIAGELRILCVYVCQQLNDTRLSTAFNECNIPYVETRDLCETALGGGYGRIEKGILCSTGEVVRIQQSFAIIFCNNSALSGRS